MSSIIKRSLRNSFFSTMSMVIVFLITLFTAGYNIRVLGEHLAGFYFLLYSIIGIGQGVLALGLGDSIIKYVSESIADKKIDKIKKICETTLFLNILLGFLFSGVLIILAKLIVAWSKLPEEYNNGAVQSIYFFSFSIIMNLSFTSFQTLSVGYQKYHYQTIINTSKALLNGISIIVALTFFPSILNLSIAIFISSVMTLIISFIIVYKMSGLKIMPKFNRTIFTELKSYSLAVFLTQQANSVRDYADRFVLNSHLGSGSLPGYSLSQRVVQTFSGTLSGVVHFIFPLFSELQKTRPKNYLSYVYFISQWFFISGVSVLASVIYINSYNILYIWIGHSFAENNYLYLELSSIQLLINLSLAIPYYIALGLAKVKTNLYIGLIQSFLVLFISILFIPSIGILGASLSQLSVFIVFLVQQIYLKKYVLTDIKIFHQIIPIALPFSSFFMTILIVKSININSTNIIISIILNGLLTILLNAAIIIICGFTVGDLKNGVLIILKNILNNKKNEKVSDFYS